MTILLAILTGATLGYLIERGDLCFHSTLRGLVRRPPELDLFRAYILIILIATPLVWVMRALGWIKPWIPPLVWPANLVGGLIFGIGTVLAATCVTGLFYKLGHGMLGTLVGLAGWAAGDIITYRGLLSPLREMLSRNIVTMDGQAATLLNSLGSVSGVVLVALWIGGALWLWRSPRPARRPYWGWLMLGLSIGLFTALAWLLARAGGSDYTFGTSGVPAGVVAALQGESRGGSLWIPLTLVSLVPGAFIAARRSGTLWIRGETLRRYLELGGGGWLMGVGAAIAGGCNLGHGLVGVPLLSLGSITTVLAMLVGVWLADRALKFSGATRSATHQPPSVKTVL
jgi:uncharacterized membrane protein YedE/YeeE